MINEMIKSYIQFYLDHNSKEAYKTKASLKKTCVVDVYSYDTTMPYAFDFTCKTDDERIACQLKIQDFFDAEYRRVAKYALDNKFLFDKLYLATVNLCNGSCKFCPGSKRNEEWNFMSDQTLERIISELHRLDYSGRIILHGLNDPLVDKRFSEICKILKKDIPKCKLQITTNGILLDLDLFQEVIDYVDIFYINIYDDFLQIPPRLMKVIDFVDSNSIYLNKVNVYPRRGTDILAQHGSYGNCGRKKILEIRTPCLRPFSELAIMPNGNVSICITDYKETLIFGNVNKRNLDDIWFCDTFIKARSAAVDDRCSLSTCIGCDIF